MPAVRILLLTRNFPPLVGGMERLLYHVFTELSLNHQVALAGPIGAGQYVPENTDVIETPIRPMWRFLMQITWTGLKLTRALRPHIVFAGSGLTSLPALLAARLSRCRVVVYLHGLDLVERHPLYRWFFLPAIRRCDSVLVNSHHTAQLAIAARINPSRIHILHPGTALPKAIAPEELTKLRTVMALVNRSILLSVGRLTPRKGLLEFIEQCLPLIIKQRPDVLLLVIGDDPKDAANTAKESMRQRIEASVVRGGLGNHVRLLGTVDESLLNAAYALANVAVFPLREEIGDIEGFGMVAIEAAAHGTPTVAFAVGGISDAIQDGVSGRLVPPGDYAGFASNILAILEQPNKFPACREFAAQFSWPKFGEKLRRMVGELIKSDLSREHLHG